jgi:hypothetical protein
LRGASGCFVRACHLAIPASGLLAGIVYTVLINIKKIDCPLNNFYHPLPIWTEKSGQLPALVLFRFHRMVTRKYPIVSSAFIHN